MSTTLPGPIRADAPDRVRRPPQRSAAGAAEAAVRRQRRVARATEWLPRLRAGGVNLVVCAVYIDSIFLPEGALRRAVQLVDALLEEIAACPEIELALTLADVERITAEGRIAALLAFEGAEPLGQDLAALRLFYRLGLRMLSFAWMRRTAFGDGAWENDSRGGLTRLGRQAVREMNRLGIIADVSHASDQTTWDVLESSTQPVIASHSNVRAIRDHPRNLTDDMIEAIAASGGLVGVVAVAGYIADSEPTIARWADHIDHIVTAGRHRPRGRRLRLLRRDHGHGRGPGDPGLESRRRSGSALLRRHDEAGRTSPRSPPSCCGVATRKRICARSTTRTSCARDRRGPGRLNPSPRRHANPRPYIVFPP